MDNWNIRGRQQQDARTSANILKEGMLASSKNANNGRDARNIGQNIIRRDVNQQEGPWQQQRLYTLTAARTTAAARMPRVLPPQTEHTPRVL
jgi:hypothetical protein